MQSVRLSLDDFAARGPDAKVSPRAQSKCGGGALTWEARFPPLHSKFRDPPCFYGAALAALSTLRARHDLCLNNGGGSDDDQKTRTFGVENIL